MEKNISSWRRSLRSFYRTILILLNFLICVPTYVIWCLLFYPFKIINPKAYWSMEESIFQGFLTVVSYWCYSAEYDIVETGDYNCKFDLANDETLVLVNHQSTSDVPLIMSAFSTQTCLPIKFNWIMDDILKYTFFGIVSVCHDDFFIGSGRPNRDHALVDLRHYLNASFLPREQKWFMLFPEGGFLRNRRERNKIFAKEKQLPNIDYVTFPRLGAFNTIMQTMAPTSSRCSISEEVIQQPWANPNRLKYVIDVTIAYPDGIPLDLFQDIVKANAPSCKVRIHYKVYQIDEVPHKTFDEMESWLYNLYVEKNNMLGHYYKTGIWNPVKFAKKDINVKSRNGSKKLRRLASSKSIASVASCPCRNNCMDSLECRSESLDKNNNRTISTPDYAALDDECIYEPLSWMEWEELEAGDKVLVPDISMVTFVNGMFFLSTAFHFILFYLLYQWILKFIESK